MPTMASLFDGIGGFVLAGARHGIQTLWASEIEAFPIAVTKYHFPEMFHVGDITKLDGATLPPVDIVCGGSPCQDLSVAGRRAGLEGARSGLFMEQIRVIKEMRDADLQRSRTGLAVRPRYGIWENVPGAFSSGKPKGEDFRIVLEEFIRIADSGLSVPRPPGGRWESAGCIMGDQCSLAWRVYDTQYWPGTPQRRRRIYLVADFGGHTAPQILFEQHCLLGDFEESEAARQIAAEPVGNSPEHPEQAHEIEPHFSFHINQREETIDLHGVSGALLACRSMQMQTFVTDAPPACFNPFQSAKFDLCYTENRSPTLRSGSATAVMEATLYENHAQDCRYNGPLEVAPTIQASYGTGGNNTSLVAQPKAYCLSGNIIDREPHNGGNGFGCQEDISYTITTCDHHAVFSQQRSDSYHQSDIASTQTARQHKDATDLVYQKNVGTLMASDRKGPNNQYVNDDKCVIMPGNFIRRLTPLECERLQGFPDFWTDIPTGASDSARYKALGNSVSIPVVAHVLHGVSYFLQQEGDEHI